MILLKKDCSEYTGLTTITKFGIINAPNAAYNAAYWSINSPLNSYSYSSYSTALNPFSHTLSCMVGPAGQASKIYSFFLK
jgi:hypothetical protein